MLTRHHAPNSRAGRIVWLQGELANVNAWIDRIEQRPAFQVGINA